MAIVKCVECGAEITKEDEIQNSFAINFLGPINLIKTFIPLLRLNGGRIINISSTSAMNPVPYAGIYAASKCALEGACDALRLELFHMNIKISSLRPGNINTPIWNKVKNKMLNNLEKLENNESILYRKDIESLLKILADNNHKALDPSIVAKKILTVLNSKNPKAYYLIGKSAWIQFIAKTIIPITYFDAIKRKIFFQNRHQKDWSGEKYKIVEEMGERIDMIFGRTDCTTEHVDWFIRSHARSDGISAFVDLTKKIDNMNIGELPSMKEIPTPSLVKRFFLLIKYLKESKTTSYNWKKFFPHEKGDTSALSYFFYSKEETKKIITHCRAKNISITSFLLYHLNSCVNEIFLNDQFEVVWLLPVNFRQKGIKNNSSANHTSSLSVRIRKTYSENQLHDKIHDMLKEGVQWGAWIYSNIPKYIGLNAMRFIYKHLYKGHYLGLFSNIGNWPPENTSNNHDNILYLGGAPGTSLSLINAVCISWNERLNMTLQIHPKISKEESDTCKLMYSWIKRVMNTCEMENNEEILNKRVKSIKTTALMKRAARF